MRRNKGLKVLMVIVIAALAAFVFGSVVMGLWNAILVKVLGVKAITFVQALGILLLSKILFGGAPRGGCGWRGRKDWKMWMRMKEKLETMTPEEREKMKAEWKKRCGGRWQMEETE